MITAEHHIRHSLRWLRGESMVYRFTYKCRLCGKKYTMGSVTSDVVNRDIVLALVDKPSSAFKNHIHLCRNGSIGVSDLIGARYV